MSKLHFTNDCDPDLTICELQHENDRLIKEMSDMDIELDYCGKSNADLETRLKELQHKNEKLNKRIDEAEAWLRIASDPNHNPVFVANGITQDYFGEESQ